MKPTWEDAPGWAQYLTQNESGQWWWHSHRPTASQFRWVVPRWAELCITEHPAGRGEPNPHWFDTLEVRPDPSVD